MYAHERWLLIASKSEKNREYAGLIGNHEKAIPIIDFIQATGRLSWTVTEGAERKERAERRTEGKERDHRERTVREHNSHHQTRPPIHHTTPKRATTFPTTRRTLKMGSLRTRRDQRQTEDACTQPSLKHTQTGEGLTPRRHNVASQTSTPDGKLSYSFTKERGGPKITEKETAGNMLIQRIV